MNRVAIFSVAEDGHRSSYINFSKKIMTADRINRDQLIGWPGLVIFLMIEENFFLYFWAAVVRAFLGRRTAGLLFRPLQCVERSTRKLKLKYHLLRMLKVNSHISTLTILPFDVDFRFSKIAVDALPDFQLWDLDPSERLLGNTLGASLGEAATKVLAAAAGRKILVSLGGQDSNKGFDVFADLYIRNPVLRKSWLFAYAGRTGAGLDDISRNFIKVGGYADDRIISDKDLSDMYEIADLVWGYYSEDYDQASGIIGRALQLGVPPLVRRGSLMDKLSMTVDVPILRASNSELVFLLTNGLTPPRDRVRGSHVRNHFEKQAIKALSRIIL